MLLCGLKNVNLVGFNLLGALSSDLTFCDLFLLAWMMHGWKCWSKKFQEKYYFHLSNEIDDELLALELRGG